MPRMPSRWPDFRIRDIIGVQAVFRGGIGELIAPKICEPPTEIRRKTG